MMADQYLTIAASATGYFMNSGSKFHAHMYPVMNEDEAQHYLQALRKEHPKARHFCTAIRLLPDGSFTRSSDDGEPSGSAGKPMSGQLLKHNVTYVFAVVVRYFGGTKLGVPGLIEAYKASMEDAFQKATIIQRTLFGQVQVKLPFDAYPGFINFLLQHGYQVIDSAFDQAVTLTFILRESTLPGNLLLLLRDYSLLDFSTIAEYASKLGWEIAITGKSILQ